MFRDAAHHRARVEAGVDRQLQQLVGFGHLFAFQTVPTRRSSLVKSSKVISSFAGMISRVVSPPFGQAWRPGRSRCRRRFWRTRWAAPPGWFRLNHVRLGVGPPCVGQARGKFGRGLGQERFQQDGAVAHDLAGQMHDGRRPFRVGFCNFRLLLGQVCCPSVPRSSPRVGPPCSGGADEPANLVRRGRQGVEQRPVRVGQALGRVPQDSPP